MTRARNTAAAFRWIVDLLRRRHVKFKLSGGLAARVYGSRRELNDIDIFLDERDIIALAPSLRRFAIFGPKRYRDRNWDVFLLTVRYRGQDIDLAGVRTVRIFDAHRHRWRKNPARLSTSTRKRLYGLTVPVVTKSDLLEYKKSLNRRVDRLDVGQIN